MLERAMGGDGDMVKPTLCENKVVLLDEVLEGVGLQLRHIGSTDESGEQGRADGRALHTGRTKLQLKCRWRWRWRWSGRARVGRILWSWERDVAEAVAAGVLSQASSWRQAMKDNRCLLY